MKCREVEGVICESVLLKVLHSCEPFFKVLVIRPVSSRLGDSVLNQWVQSTTEFDYNDDGVDIEQASDEVLEIIDIGTDASLVLVV